MTKGLFYRIFNESWNQVMTSKNITSAFAASGLVPFELSRVLNKIKTKAPILEDSKSNELSISQETPESPRGV